MRKVKVIDNGSAFCVTVDGMIVSAHNSLGGAWNHIAWMHRVANQRFVIGDKEVPVKDWLEAGIRNGFLEDEVGYRYT